MEKYITLVFKADTLDPLAVIEMLKHGACEDYAVGHAILRLKLLQQALEADNIEKAKSHFDEVDVNQLDPSPLDDLFAEPINQLETLRIT